MRHSHTLIFLCGILVSFILFKLVYPNPSPDSTFATLSLVLTLSYPMWRKRNGHKSIIKIWIVSVLATYWFYEAYFRISNSVMQSFHHYVHPLMPVSNSKAILGSIPFLLIFFAFVIDELFIKRRGIPKNTDNKYEEPHTNPQAD
jgi:drug/metabolite transporter (DMT)-like permease